MTKQKQAVNLIFGPPGTGKTTCLLRQIEKDLEKVKATDIAFVSFTKKGVSEGLMRAKAKFKLSSKDLMYFRTLHSMCFRELRTRKKDLVMPWHYHQLGKALGVKLSGLSKDHPRYEDDVYLQCDHLLRNNFDSGVEMHKELEARRFNAIVGAYTEMKRQCGLYDFTDLLQQYLLVGEPLPVKRAYIDEAQDLTPLQWKVVHKLFSKSHIVYIAGDDDQAIYTWAGADVSTLIAHPHTNKIVLGKSFRLPKEIHAYASKITERICPDRREPKVFEPSDHPGAVIHCAGWSKAALYKGSNLILARTGHTLGIAKKWLEDAGVPYILKGQRGFHPAWPKAIEYFKKWQSGEDIHRIRRYAHLFKSLEADKPWTYCAKGTRQEVLYLARLYDHDSWEWPAVRLETIHSSKGAEADHVILALDITTKVADHFHKHFEDEMRCYYVGATRAKYTLTLKHSEEPYSYPVF